MIPKIPERPTWPAKPWTSHRGMSAWSPAETRYYRADGKPLTLADVDAWEREVEPVMREAERAFNAGIKAALDAAEAVLRDAGFGAPAARFGAKRPKGLRDALKPFVPGAGSVYFGSVRDQVRAERAWCEAEAKRTSQADQERKEVERRDRAILFLAARGKALGADFTSANAVAVANDIARVEEIARRMAEGGPFEFSGDDNCEDCSGWDGESRRCACGNRRVSWVETDWHTFEDPSVRGEAY